MMKNVIFGPLELYYIFYYAGIYNKFINIPKVILHLVQKVMIRLWKKFLKVCLILIVKNGMK